MEQTLETVKGGRASTGVDAGLQGGHSTDGRSAGLKVYDLQCCQLFLLQNSKHLVKTS